ncbi:unnamed protein product [Lymnaea stagnalis]|uniref:Persulfide dioxygenase ETHE1, mitochondrial n=1 Tax=Lymnaea stagnalis TaxID=6523 RepID=A0AAV2HFK6_LYMST
MGTKLLSVWNRINVLKTSSTVSQLICTYGAALGQFSHRCAYNTLKKSTQCASSYSSQILKARKPVFSFVNTSEKNQYAQYSLLGTLSLSVKDKSAYCSDKKSISSMSFGEDILFRQLLEYKSYTYTYLLADVATNEAVLIDPVIDTVDRDVRLVFELGLNLLYAVNTHVHADHITGSGSIKKMIPSCKSVIAEISNARADVKLKEGDIIKFGQFQLEARSTPGHTDGCMSFVWHEKGMVFTGDALLIRGCGRTDFQQGNPGTLYDSVHKKILSLPQHFKVFPGHDYTGQTMSSVGEELRFNSRLTKPKNEFIEVMGRLNLPYPKQIDKALPANMVCGVFDVPENS